MMYLTIFLQYNLQALSVNESIKISSLETGASSSTSSIIRKLTIED